MQSGDYAKRIEQQVSQYANVANIHELPEIFHYWSNKYLRPRLNEVAQADSFPEFYAKGIIQAAQPGQPVKIISLGSGDGSLEISVAKRLLERGFQSFVIYCLEMSPVLIARAQAAIQTSELSNCVVAIETDLNAWGPSRDSVDVVMAHHSLHHIVALERIFDSICTSLRRGGLFLTADMIGRNGHMRWPEVKIWIDQIWSMLPDRLKMNRSFNRFDAKFADWDCSTEGFEGIRAQDILPLILERFNFDVFLAFGGLLDIFIDRAFGHNFDASADSDKALIDFVSYLNDHLIDMGDIKPTTMIATMRPKIQGIEGASRHLRHWRPEFCVRHTA
jgi:SAM-dependent methyltransferase